MKPVALTAIVLLTLIVAATIRAAPPGTQPANAAKPRAACSIHLAYSAPATDAFYNEMNVEQSTPGSYFMACGWSHGYFGIQECGNGDKVVIFSVWDPTKGDRAKEVPIEQRVEVLHQGEGVEVKRFGGEGTGGQSFLKYEWKTGQTCRFLVRATIEGEKTSHAGYFYLPDQKAWKHVVTFRTRTGGDRLGGLYSFVEDFRRDGKSVGETRRASFGNGWILGREGEWQPLTVAKFTASRAPTEARDLIDAGVQDGFFYLQNGGETKASKSVGTKLENARAADALAPTDLPLP